MHPSRHAFTWSIRVYYEDTDIGGVVYYANYLKFFERARTEWLRALGFNQFEFATAEDRAFVVRRAEIDYKLPARMDDLLTVTVTPLEVGRASVWLAQTLIRESADASSAKAAELIALAKIQVACIRRSDGFPVKLPPTLYTQFNTQMSTSLQAAT